MLHFFISTTSQIATPVFALFFMLILDTVTGIALSVKFKTFSVTALTLSIKKLFLYLLSILSIRIFELGISAEVDFVYISFSVTYYILLTETLSVFKNLAGLGVTIPLVSLLNLFIKEGKTKKGELELNDILDITSFIKEDMKLDEKTPMKHFLTVFLDLYYHAYLVTNSIISKNFPHKEKLLSAILSYLDQLQKITADTLENHHFSQCDENQCDLLFQSYGSFIKKRCVEAIEQATEEYELKRRFKEIFSLVCFNILISYKNNLK